MKRLPPIRDAAEMVYGRLNVMTERFLEDAIVYVHYVDPDQAAPIPAIHEPESIQLRRQVFRGAAEDEYGKRLRWQAELKWQPKIGGRACSREISCSTKEWRFFRIGRTKRQTFCTSILCPARRSATFVAQRANDRAETRRQFAECHGAEH